MTSHNPAHMFRGSARCSAISICIWRGLGAQALANATDAPADRHVSGRLVDREYGDAH